MNSLGMSGDETQVRNKPLCFNGHFFSGGPGLAGTRMSAFWKLLELRVAEVVVSTEAIRCAKLQSKCHHQQTSTQLFTGQMLFLSPNQQRQSIEGKQVRNKWRREINGAPG